MSTASSAAVATPFTVVRILLFICCGLLLVNIGSTVDAKESMENESIGERALNKDCSVGSVTTTEWDPVCGSDGISYNNMEELLEETCKKPSLKFDHAGICIGDCQHFGGEALSDKCLFFSGKQELHSWEDAEVLCHRKGGELARFDQGPAFYLDEIEKREKNNGGGMPTYWVGGHDSSAESDWEWSNGVDISLNHREFPWGGDGAEPNGEGVQNCLNMMDYDHEGSYKYTDGMCSTPLQYICEIGCPFNGIIYPPGTFIQDACAQLQCDGVTGRFDNLGYDLHCKKCTAWGDPHIITYDTRYITTATTGTCSLSRYGSRSPQNIKIDGEFFSCGNGNVACLGDVFFKNDENTVLTCSFDNKLHKILIQVNGKDVNMAEITDSPSIINVDGTDYPVLAWTSSYTSLIRDRFGNPHIQSCVSLQGSSGILVQFCGDHNTSYANSVNIWATPDLVSGLKGFCGTVGNYDQVCISKKSDTSTFSRKNTKCDTNSTLSDHFKSQCHDAILKGVHTAETAIEQPLIDGCVFDLCHVSDPDQWIGSVHAAMPKHHETKEKTVGHCVHKRTHKCKTNNGNCILNTETCNGTIIEHGCHGKKCTCCAPNPCKQNQECLKKDGKCILRKDWAGCDGNVNSELCSGKDCACCYPKVSNICKKSKKCSEMNGECIGKWNWKNCDGKLKEKWCKGKTCGCCYQ